METLHYKNYRCAITLARASFAHVQAIHTEPDLKREITAFSHVYRICGGDITSRAHSPTVLHEHVLHHETFQGFFVALTLSHHLNALVHDGTLVIRRVVLTIHRESLAREKAGERKKIQNLKNGQ